jgi:hypothetical protein
MLANRSINIKNALKNKLHRQKFKTALTALRILFVIENDLQRIRKKRSNLMMLREKEDFHTNDMMKSFKSF